MMSGQEGHVESGHPLSIDVSGSGTRVCIATASEPLLEWGRALLAAGRPFVAVARSLAAAVRLTRWLAPEADDLLVRAALAEAGQPRVALLRSHVKPSQWRSRLAHVASGETLGLVLTPDDLAAFGVVEALEQLGETTRPVWLVEDVHRASVYCRDYLPQLRTLARVTRASSRVFFTDLHAPQVLTDLGRLLSFSIHDVEYSSAELPPAVSLTVDVDPTVLSGRDALAAGLRRHLPEGGVRAVVVAPIRKGNTGGLPATELVSVGQELGLDTWQDPGEDLDVEASRWQSLLTREGLLLTDNADALDILPGGSRPLFLRLVPPSSPEEMAQELRSLARRQGGHWVYVGAADLPRVEVLPSSLLATALTTLVSRGGDQLAPLAFDAADVGIPPEHAPALHQALARLMGLDFLQSCRRVQLALEVADASRFRAPFINIDPRYVALAAAYERARQGLPLMESVRFKLEAREPHDLRRFAQMTGYDVWTLCGLFDDMAREGLVLSTQRSVGAASLNLEVVPNLPWSELLTRLPEVLDAYERSVELLHRAHADMVEVLSSSNPGVALSRVLQADRETSILPTTHVVPRPLPEVAPVVELAPLRVVVETPVVVPVVDGVAQQLALLGELADSPLQLGVVLRAVGEFSSIRHPAPVLRQLERGNLHSRLVGALAQSVWGDGEGAVVALTTLCREGHSLPMGELIPRVEFFVKVDDGVCVDELPSALRAAAWGLPLLEAVSPEQVARLLPVLGEGVELQLGDLGSATAVVGAHVFALVRRGAAPELEAELWRLSGEGDDTFLSRRAARLAEVWLSTPQAWTGEEARHVATIILGHGDTPPVGVEANRWAFVLTRAQQELGRVEEALTSLVALEPPAGMVQEWARALVDVSVRGGRPEVALEVLTHRNMPRPAFVQLGGALQKVCLSRASCEECSLRGSNFCPVDAEFFPFVAREGLGEGAAALRTRVGKRAEAGILVPDLHTLVYLVDHFGTEWPSPVLVAWIAQIEGGEASLWAQLAERFMGESEQAQVARQLLDRARAADPTDQRTRRVALRSALMGGDLKAAVELGAELGGDTLQRALGGRGAQVWEEIGTLLDGGTLSPEASDLVRPQVEAVRRRNQREQLRHTLEAALQSGGVVEVLAAAEEWRLAGADPTQDRLLLQVARGRQDREGRIRDRLKLLVARPPERLHAPEVEALLKEATLLKMEEETQLRGMWEAAVTAAAQRPAPAAPAERPTPAANQQESRGGRRPREEGNNTRRDSGSRPPEQRRGGGETTLPREVLTGDPAVLAERIKDAALSADNDRERNTPVREGLLALYRSGQGDRAAKVVRDVGGAYQRPEQLDDLLARMIDRSEIPEADLGTLKKVLTRQSASFRRSLELLSVKDNPEPWKQLLSQLKINS